MNYFRFCSVLLLRKQRINVTEYTQKSGRYQHRFIGWRQAIRWLLCLIVLVAAPPYTSLQLQASPTAPIQFDATRTSQETAPKNIILLIGDGMGEEHVIAAGMYANGSHNTLVFEDAPYQAKMQTHSANSAITDSAASATAMATGQKVNNGVISMGIPGGGQHLETVLEFFRDRCKSTGLVVTSVINHATPAAFTAHSFSRIEYSSLLEQTLEFVTPTVLMGGGPIDNGDVAAAAAGYTIATNRTELEALTLTGDTKVYARFGSGDMAFEHEYNLGLNSFYNENPHLSEMAAKSLELLETDEDGFFLMIEGSRIDHASHGNALPQMVAELLEFDQTVQLVLDWAADRDDTLVIVTADHETGGLRVRRNLGKGSYPQVLWTTSAHTAQNVDVYGWGPNADLLTGQIDNTYIYNILTANSATTTSCAKNRVQPAPDSSPIETVDVTLRWQSNDDPSVSGFHLMRSADSVFDHAVAVTYELIPATNNTRYEFTDTGLNVQIDYSYWLVIVSKDGTTTVSDQIDVPRSEFIMLLPIAIR